jgi:AraC-like DNA-binding protein
LTLNQASEAIGTSSRVMQRGLSAEGTTYRELLGETRAQIAADMLEKTSATMSEIAEKLGYGSQGNFTRAFCRWAAVSPRRFRAQRTATTLREAPDTAH